MPCRGDPACDLPFFDRDTPAGSAELTLPAGPATLTTTLTRGDAATFGAYYVKVELLEAIP